MFLNINNKLFKAFELVPNLPAISLPELSEEVYLGGRNGTFTTVSKVTFGVKAKDDGTEVTCVAEHPAIEKSEEQRLTKTVTLNVLCE